MHDEIEFKISNCNEIISSAIKDLEENKIVERIWEKDYTVWSSNSNEIFNRLAWLDSPFEMANNIDEINLFVDEVRNENFERAVLLGMGGSSLAPEVFRLTFGVRQGFLDLSVVDTTNPDAIIEIASQLNYSKTLFIVSTKSGGTIETLSLMKYFYNEVVSHEGRKSAGNHFIAITDPGSKLVKIANELNFRKSFINNPNIGGRFSVLSYFGLIPAALIGVDIKEILKRAQTVAKLSKKSKNDIAILGAVLGKLANLFVDKATFVTSPQIRFFQAWVEQLIAESTGKSGKGIFPVVDEELLNAEDYGEDRVFVLIKMKSDTEFDLKKEIIQNTKLPVIEIEMKDEYDIGGQFFIWEFATAIAGWKMGIHPFNQPNVESAKAAAKKIINEYSLTGKLPEIDFDFEENGVQISSFCKTNNLNGLFREIIKSTCNKTVNGPVSYFALQAFMNPSNKVKSELQKLRTALTQKYKLAATIGFGPRFLHSTGQLHKGDSGNGIFLQFVCKPEKDIPIPDAAASNSSSVSFAILFRAQALGDRQALIDVGRDVVTFDLGRSDINKLQYIIKRL